MTTPAAWATAMTNGRIANDLQRLADNIRFHDIDDRKALLREAARRLLPVSADHTDALRALIANGLTFGAAMHVFAEGNTEYAEKFITAARNQGQEREEWMLDEGR